MGLKFLQERKIEEVTFNSNNVNILVNTTNGVEYSNL
jgi:hypothetical protein